MKKILCALLAVAMILSLSACKDKTNEKVAELSYEIGDTGGLEVPFSDGEELRFVVVNSTQSTATYIFDKLSEITGVKLNVVSLPVSAYKEKLQVMIASKDVPDVIGDGINGIYELNDLAGQGAFASVNDHIDVMPNFKRLFGEGSEDNWVFESYAASDGKLYALPSYDVSRDVNHGMLYRKDIFDKYGIEMWNSPETFYQALKTLKEKDPDCIPFTSKNQYEIIFKLSHSWGIVGNEMYFDEVSKKWKYSDTDPKMKNMLDFLRKLYAEELLDPEFLTLTQADWTKKMTSNISYVTFDWIGRMDMFASQSEIEGYDLRYANPIGPEQTIMTLPKVFEMFSAVANNDKQETSMKFIDFLYSDAGAELMTLGIKGETYEIGEDGKAVYIGFDKDKKVEITDLEEKYGIFMQGSYRRIDRRSCSFDFSEKEQEAQDLAVNNNMFEPKDPVLAFIGGEQEKINDIKSALVTKFQEFMFKYVVTGEGDWDEWLKSAKKLGEDEIVKIYNDAHNRLGL